MHDQLRRLALLASLLTLALSALLATPAVAGAARSCEARSVSQPFLPWLDVGHYFLFAGGDLESTRGWTLSGGAQLVAGNEPYLVTSRGDTHSLLLPPGSAARTASACVDSAEPTVRFFVRNTGSPLSTLRVDVQFEDALGVQHSLPTGLVLGGGNWAPSLPTLLVANLLPLLPGKHTPVRLRFVPQGAGAWQIDDVYVDPFKRL